MIPDQYTERTANLVLKLLKSIMQPQKGPKHCCHLKNGLHAVDLQPSDLTQATSAHQRTNPNSLLNTPYQEPQTLHNARPLYSH